MYLKNINVTGFKSFGAKNVLDFPREGKGKQRSFTAVVGPNGSGKSNIADAIRWALGEQSSKLLRVKKNEDVIFFGSAKKGKGSFTEISMTLDNSDKSAPVDLTEIEVTRRLYRNGDNEYLINRKKVRLLDVQELLAKCGIGRSTYTVIGQGMVDSLLFYGPAERKVLFEEASGVKQYEIKRSESIRKLDATDKNIIRIKDLLYELEPRLKQAERQNKKFQKKQEIETELDELSRKYYTNVLSDITGKKSVLDAKLEKLREQEGVLKSEIVAIEARIAKGLKAQGSDKEEKELKAKIDGLYSKKNVISQQIYKIQAESEAVVSVYAREKDGLVREKETCEREIANLKERSARISTENGQLAERLNGAKKELEGIDVKIVAANEELAKAQRESVVMGKDDISRELESVSADYKKIVTQISTVKDLKSLTNLKSGAEELSQKMDELIRKIKKSQNADTSNIEKKQEEIGRLSGNKEIILKEIQDLRVREISRAETLKNIDTQAKDYGSRLEVAGQKIAKLEKPAEKDSSEVNKLISEKEKLESEITGLKAKLEKIENASASGDYSKVLEEEKAKRAEISRVGDDINSAMVELARVETKSDDLKSEIHEFLGEAFYKEISDSRHSGNVQNPSENVEHLMPKIQRLRKDMYALGEIDHFIKEEFEELEVRVGELSSQLGDLEKAKTDILKIIGELDIRIKTQFQATFARISEEFTKYFKILFNGGNATLNLETDEEGNFGVEIGATPPGKKNQSLNSLSGGERALTSIALLFAILSVNPSPFCVLDEVDASLDETNTERFLKILQTLSHKTQFVVVTHNRESMKKADIIYGVSMDDNHVSQVYSLKLTEV
ncbi:MAG: AAA family ATPase [bacterium]|nr:AAA family ATPase [bacterium]